MLARRSPFGQPDVRPWARTVFAATLPFATGGVYVNFLGDEGDARARANQNVRPA
jgi:hypothetical protein